MPDEIDLTAADDEALEDAWEKIGAELARRKKKPGQVEPVSEEEEPEG